MVLLPQSACVIGVGGLGCPAATVLALSGVPRLTLIDADVVELSNLHRQLLHTDADLKKPKVISAREKLLARFPSLHIEAHQRRCGKDDAPELFRTHDVVIDATDGADTKFMLSDVSVQTGTPLIYAGALRWDGVIMRIEPGGPCLRCVFEAPPAEALTCAQAGIVGSLVALVGTLQGMEALKPTRETLTTIDGRSLAIRRIRARRRPDCPACGSRSNQVSAGTA